MNEIETAVQTTPGAVQLATPTNVEVSATNPDEMASAQSKLISWAASKVNELKAELAENEGALACAEKSKWRTEPLRRIVAKSVKRLTFYQKLMAALQAGFTIVPNFPVTAFVIRTERKNPTRMSTQVWRVSHEQSPEGLPAGDGDYKNPHPNIGSYQLAPATATTGEVREYFSKDWKDLEFPITMCKPTIMEAVNRAMALKIFDDLGVLPGFVPVDRSKRPQGDPLIVARIYNKATGSTYYAEKHVTFMVAWHVNTREL